MTAIPIDNHPLTQRRLQFIGISVNKLTLKSIKSISIIQSSNNYNIVSSFICWNQNIVHMKILDTSLKMQIRSLFLAMDLSITNGKISFKSYDKPDDFNFQIVNVPLLDGDVPQAPSYGVYTEQK